MRRVRVLSSVLAVAALVALAACGGDKKETSTTTTVAAATTPTTKTFSGSDPNSAFCQLGRANNERLKQIGASAANPDELDKVLRDAAPAVRQAASIAPPEIKPDVEVLAKAFEDLLKSLDEGTPNLAAIVSPEFQTAAQNLTAYGQQVCGIAG